MATRLSMIDQPLMEVAELSAGGSSRQDALPITAAMQESSPVVDYVSPGTRLKLLSMCRLPDSSCRASVLVDGPGNSTHGWVTISTADGTKLVHRFGRPIYEVANGATLKLRRQCDMGSKFVTRVSGGARLHIIEIRRMADGGARALIALLNHQKFPGDKPLGWITAMKPKASSPLRELFRDGNDSATPGLRICQPPYGAPMPVRAVNPIMPKHSPINSPQHSPQHSRANSPERNETGGSFFGTAAQGEPAQAGLWATVRSAVVAGSLPHARGGWSSGGAKARGGRPASAPPQADHQLSKPKTTMVARLSPPHTASTATDPALTPQVDEPLKSRGKQPAVELLGVEEILAARAKLLEKAATTDNNLTSKEFRTLQVMLGEALLESYQKDASGKWVDNLVRDWDPNRDGTLTKMEFRTNVRRTIPNVEKTFSLKEIDDLFSQLDYDHSGEMDIGEVKKALLKLKQTAARAAATCTKVHGDTAELRAKAESFQRVVDATKEYEKAAAALAMAEQQSVGAQLGSILKSKGFKVADLVHKWSGAKQSISRSDFKREVLRLGIAEGAHEEIDTLFTSLDTNHGGSLDVDEMKEAVHNMVEEGTMARAQVRQLKVLAQLKATEAGKAQALYQQERDADLAMEADIAERAAAAASHARAEAAMDREEKQRMADEKKAREASEKQAFEARIAAKRAAK